MRKVGIRSAVGDLGALVRDLGAPLAAGGVCVPFVVGVQAEYNLPRWQVRQEPTHREAEYGSRLQYMSGDGWLGSMA
jgi:hypothetical protein